MPPHDRGQLVADGRPAVTEVGTEKFREVGCLQTIHRVVDLHPQEKLLLGEQGGERKEHHVPEQETGGDVLDLTTEQASPTRRGVFDRQEHRTAPLAADAPPLGHAQHHEQALAPRSRFAWCSAGGLGVTW